MQLLIAFLKSLKYSGAFTHYVECMPKRSNFFNGPLHSKYKKIMSLDFTICFCIFISVVVEFWSSMWY